MNTAKLTVAHVSPAIAKLKAKIDLAIAESQITDEMEIDETIREVVYDGSVADLLAWATDPYPDTGAEFVTDWPRPMLFRIPEMEYADASPIAQIEQNIVAELERLFGR